MNRRLERQAQRRKAAQEAILDAAERALAGAGLKGMTMEGIAKQAGYTAGALYSYFTNKDAIVGALFDRLGDEMMACFSHAVSEEISFADELQQRLELLMEVARRRAGLFFAHFVQGIDPSDHQERHTVVHNDFIQALAGVLRRGIAEGAIRDADPLDLAMAFIGIQREFFIRWLYSGQREAIEERAATALTLFLCGARPDSGGPKEGTEV